jgi:hypothetical protein
MGTDETRWEIGDDKNAADMLAEIEYERPPGFAEEVDGPMTMLHEPAEEIVFIVIRTNRDAGDQAMAQLDAVLATFIKDFKPAGAPSGGTWNGIRGMQAKATGVCEGKPANVTIRLLEAQPRKYVVIACAYLTERKEALKDTVNRFFRSVRSISSS